MSHVSYAVAIGQCVDNGIEQSNLPVRNETHITPLAKVDKVKSEKDFHFRHVDGQRGANRKAFPPLRFSALDFPEPLP